MKDEGWGMRIPNPPVREARCIFADGVPEPPSPGPFLLPRHDPSAARGRGAFERACLHGYPARCIRLPMPPKSLPPSPPGEVPPDCLSSPAPSRPPPTRSVRASDGRRCRGRGRDLHPPAPSSSRGTIRPRQEEGVPLSGLACTGIRHDASGYPCHPCSQPLGAKGGGEGVEPLPAGRRRGRAYWMQPGTPDGSLAGAPTASS
jgi:hypothetical protein